MADKPIEVPFAAVVVSAHEVQLMRLRGECTALRKAVKLLIGSVVALFAFDVVLLVKVIVAG